MHSTPLLTRVMMPLLVWGAISPLPAQTGDSCLSCHSSRAELSQNTEQVDRYLIPSEFSEESVHATEGCKQCHADAGGYPHPEVIGLRKCGSCHEIVQSDYEATIHGILWVRGEGDAPSCWDCHKLHRIRSSDDPAAQTFKLNEWKTCTKCHHGNDIETSGNIEIHDGRGSSESRDVVKLDWGDSSRLYKTSLHGIAITERKDESSATCSDCHGSHYLGNSGDPISSINRANVNDLCGRCHQTEVEQLKRSVHNYKITSQPGEPSLVCIECHREHQTTGKKNPDAWTNAARLARATCNDCHDPVVLATRFGLSAGRLRTYVESYHGAVLTSGRLAFGNCASCHGTHDIKSLVGLRSGSSLKSPGVIKSCAECHPSAEEDFSQNRIHKLIGKKMEESTIMVPVYMRWVFWILVLVFSMQIIIDVIAKLKGRVT